MPRSIFLAVAAAFLVPSLASADDAKSSQADAMIAAIAACRSLPDAERLACLDMATARLLTANEQRQIKIIDRDAVRRTKRSVFGFSLPHINFFGTGKEDARADSDTDVKEITGTITRVGEASYGLWTFVLAEGGTWQSTNESVSFTPRAGDVVRIKAGLLGHYTAKIGNDRSVDVKRLR